MPFPYQNSARGPSRSRAAALFLSIALRRSHNYVSVLGPITLGLLLGALVASCASPDKLARQSGEELSQGHAQKAYEKARKALDKDSTSSSARDAMTAAAARLAQDSRAQMLTLTSVDTLAAADVGLELDQLRDESARYRVGLPADSAFALKAERIRKAAARICYTRAENNLDHHRAKLAFQQFVKAREYWAGLPDVDERVREAYDAAVARVAVLPFANQTDVPELSRQLEAHVYEELAHRVTPDDFRFTRLMSRDEILKQMTLAELDNLNREEALKVGRKLGADEVVWGRYFGMHTTSNTDNYQTNIYQRVVERGRDGTERERYVEHPFNVVARQREVSLHYEFEILDTQTKEVLAKHADVAKIGAKVIWTDYVADASPEDYTLLSPAAQKATPDTSARVQKTWKAKVGNWKLAQFLDDSRLHRERARYSQAWRDEFQNDTRTHPVLLGELPPENDLALISLNEVWKPIYQALADLDAK